MVLCENSTQVAAHERADQIPISPNPSSSYTVFFMEAMHGVPYDLTITNINGQVVVKQSALTHRRVAFDASNLRPGLYFLTAEGERVMRSRFLVVR